MKRFNPYVNLKCNTKNGEIAIYVRYNYNRLKRTLIPIHFSTTSEHWNTDKNWIKKSSPNYQIINDALTDLMTRVGDILTYAYKNDIDWKLRIIDKYRLRCKKNGRPFAEFKEDILGDFVEYKKWNNGILMKTFDEFIMNDPNCESYLIGNFTV